MKRYTKKLHAYRLTLMMKRPKIVHCCPASRGLSVHKSFLWRECCSICQKFVGALTNDAYCPCLYFGSAKALTKTKKALEEFYQEEKKK